eukprot:5391661-Prymnesium_polylepis.1
MLPAQDRVPDALRFGSALHEGQDRHCHGHTGVTQRGRTGSRGDAPIIIDLRRPGPLGNPWP